MTKNYYLAINLANNFQSRYPGIGTTTIAGFGIEKSGRDPGIAIPNEEIVLTKLQKLNPDKSPGPDDIHPLLQLSWQSHYHFCFSNRLTLEHYQLTGKLPI